MHGAGDPLWLDGTRSGRMRLFAVAKSACSRSAVGIRLGRDGDVKFESGRDGLDEGGDDGKMEEGGESRQCGD